MKAEATGEVVYYNDDDAITGTTTDKGTYLNEKGKWFEVFGCLCGRTLEKADLVLLGISDKNARDFLEGVNAAVERYSINTCLRISHFLAQARHESGDFKYLKEIWGHEAHTGASRV